MAPKRGAFQVVRRHCSTLNLPGDSLWHENYTWIFWPPSRRGKSPNPPVFENRRVVGLQMKGQQWMLTTLTPEDWKLVGGFNPFEKYARQNGNLPQIGVKWGEYKKYLKPPPRKLFRPTNYPSSAMSGYACADSSDGWPRSPCQIAQCHVAQCFFENLGWNGTPCCFIQWLSLGESVISYASHYKQPQSGILIACCRYNCILRPVNKTTLWWIGTCSPSSCPWRLNNSRFFRYPSQ